MTQGPTELAAAAACLQSDRFGPHNKDEGMHTCPQPQWLLAMVALGAAYAQHAAPPESEPAVLVFEDDFEADEPGAAPGAWRVATQAMERHGMVVDEDAGNRYLANGMPPPGQRSAFAILERPHRHIHSTVRMSYYFDTKADKTQHIYLATRHESFSDWSFVAIYPDRLRLVDKKDGAFHIENFAKYDSERDTWYEVCVRTLGTVMQVWVKRRADPRPWDEVLLARPAISSGPTPLAMNTTSRIRLAMNLRDAENRLRPGVMRLDDFHIMSYAGRRFPVSFADVNLDRTVREAVGKRTGYLYNTDLAGLSVLASNGAGIRRLNGLEFCTDLSSVFLWFEPVEDVGPLSMLPKLEYLDLLGCRVADIGPLVGLPKLTRLGLADLSHPDGLDISPLADPTFDRLIFLNLDGCGLETRDLEPLSGKRNPATLSHIEALWLRRNNLTDLQPLLDNPHLGPHVTVKLDDNPLTDHALER